MYVILVYDISQTENGRKRWSHVFKMGMRTFSWTINPSLSPFIMLL